MTRKRVTIMDIAREANVDSSTVSLALRGDPRIRHSTRTKIESVANQFGYTPNHIARSLSGGATRVIGVMLTDMQRFLADPLEELQSFGEMSGYTVATHFSWWNQDREYKELRKFCESRVEGIILAPAEGGSERFAQTMQELHQAHIPTVVLGLVTAREHSFCNQVGVDMKKALRLGLEYLLKQGHRRIGIAAAKSMPGMRGILHRKRLQMAVDVFAELGLPLADEDLLDTPDNEHGGIDIAAAMVSRSRDRWPSAIFAFDDLLSRGLLKGFNALGVSIPDKISVLGYDVAPDEPMGHIPMTSVCVETRMLARWAIEALFKAIRQEVPIDTYQYLEVPARIVEGKSVANLRHPPA
jgi:DNA-binding LacI/PurR family transcriptional regulator